MKTISKDKKNSLEAVYVSYYFLFLLQVVTSAFAFGSDYFVIHLVFIVLSLPWLYFALKKDVVTITIVGNKRQAELISWILKFWPLGDMKKTIVEQIKKIKKQ